MESQKETAHTPLTDEEKKMVSDFEQYLSPLIRCGYMHAIQQLREWNCEPHPHLDLHNKLTIMEENKQEVDKALLSKEMEAYTKDRALLASQLSTAQERLEEMANRYDAQQERALDYKEELSTARQQLEELKEILVSVQKAYNNAPSGWQPTEELNLAMVRIHVALYGNTDENKEP